MSFANIENLLTIGAYLIIIAFLIFLVLWIFSKLLPRKPKYTRRDIEDMTIRDLYPVGSTIAPIQLETSEVLGKGTVWVKESDIYRRIR